MPRPGQAACPDRPQTRAVLDDLPAEDLVTVDLVRRIPPQRNKDWFVAAPFHNGVELGLWEVKEKPPGLARRMADLAAAGARSAH